MTSTRSKFDNHATPLFISRDAVEDIAHAAQLCTGKKVKDKALLLKRLLQAGHYAPFEFATCTFQFNVSRACMAQLTRHRHFSFMCTSQFYQEQEARYQCPDTSKFMLASLSQAHLDYEELLKQGMTKDAARYMLPEASEVTMMMSGNFRAWYEFLEKRMCKRNSPEMYTLATQIHTDLQALCPEVFNYAGPWCAHHGSCRELIPCGQQEGQVWQM
jgi:thymidylate synthase (FAD)